jgi:hypothetical protein
MLDINYQMIDEKNKSIMNQCKLDIYIEGMMFGFLLIVILFYGIYFI